MSAGTRRRQTTTTIKLFVSLFLHRSVAFTSHLHRPILRAKRSCSVANEDGEKSFSANELGENNGDFSMFTRRRQRRRSDSASLGASEQDFIYENADDGALWYDDPWYEKEQQRYEQERLRQQSPNKRRSLQRQPRRGDRNRKDIPYPSMASQQRKSSRIDAIDGRVRNPVVGDSQDRSRVDRDRLGGPRRNSQSSRSRTQRVSRSYRRGRGERFEQAAGEYEWRLGEEARFKKGKIGGRRRGFDDTYGYDDRYDIYEDDDEYGGLSDAALDNIVVSERWERWGACEVLPPPPDPNAPLPLGVVHLIGGAVVGITPRLCYDGLAEGLSRRGFLVIASPLTADSLRIGSIWNHGRLARAAAEDFRGAWTSLEERSVCLYACLPVCLPICLLVPEEMLHDDFNLNERESCR